MQLFEKTITQYLNEMVKKYPNKEMIKYCDRDYTRTFKEFDIETDKIAKGFMALGVNKGDHISMWATNIPEWLQTFFAAAKIGAVLVTVNTNYKIFEIEYLLRQSDTKVLVMNEGLKDSNYPEIINALCPKLSKIENPAATDNTITSKLPKLKNVIYCGEQNYDGMINFSSIKKIGARITDIELNMRKNSCDPHDVINIQYTSGTTGFPKGVMLTHYNITNNGLSIGDCMKFTENDKLCITVPFFHCFGLVLAILACLTHGSTMVPVDRFRPQDVLSAIESERCTAVHGVPTMFIAMLECSEFKNYDVSSLRTGIMAGSPCPIKVMEKVVEDMGMNEITIAFGQTESSPVCTQTTTEDSIEIRVSTVGRNLPMVETKIVDVETGEEVGPGVKGEFCARGYNIMKGYYNMPEETERAIDKDGWLHTGDLATKDEKGYYKIVGRIKDMIIRGGENIYPKEIEEFLYTHQAISDVQVVGVPSREYGEEIAAYVIPKDGIYITEDEIKQYVKCNMARHKIPRYIIFTDSFPMTASGKIQKFKLRDMAIEELSLQELVDIETA